MGLPWLVYRDMIRSRLFVLLVPNNKGVYMKTFTQEIYDRFDDEHDQLNPDEVFRHGMEGGFSGFIYYNETTERTYGRSTRITMHHSLNKTTGLSLSGRMPWYGVPWRFSQESTWKSSTNRWKKGSKRTLMEATCMRKRS